MRLAEVAVHCRDSAEVLLANVAVARAFGPTDASASVSLAEILSALSFALDLTEDAIPGHALRTCVLGMRLGRETGLAAGELADLYYALLLKDVGCSSNAARLCQIIGGGDERKVKAGVKLEDWTRRTTARASTLRLLWSNVRPGAGPLSRAASLVRLRLRQHQNNEEIIQMRCDRGAHIVRKLGLGETAAEAVRGLDEHWDGSGYPERRTEARIPMGSRILAVAQHLDVFATEQGAVAAMEVLRERSGRWFDPEMVRTAEHLHHDGALWEDVDLSTPAEETRAAALELAPQEIAGQACDVDLVCEAFADVVDAKSSFTFRHSLAVTEAADGIAERLGLNTERRGLVHRAALLHDVGKLRVPNSILDKPGQLTQEEWRIVEEHPRLTREILSRVRVFGELAFVAGAHHERLDGSGYPERLTAEQLPLEARIVAVADMHAALIEDRPYRPGLSREQAMRVLSKEAPARLDADCCAALDEVTG